MKKFLFAAIAAVMVSGLLLGSIDSNAFATKEDNPGKAKGCDNANNEKMKDRNAHCDSATECTEFVFWYLDADGDGLGDIEVRILSCIDGTDLPTPPSGAVWVMNADDCDDDDISIGLCA